MSFSRTRSIDTTRPDADTEHTAVMDLDADLTAAFTHLNTIDAVIQGKIPASSSGAANGICELDDGGLVPQSRLPVYPIDKLKPQLGYPIGSILPYAGLDVTAEMVGVWHECNGAVMTIAGKGALYAVIGTRFGFVAPSSFRLPDLRGRFVRGWNHGSVNDPDALTRVSHSDAPAEYGGDHVGTYQIGQNVLHTHDLVSTSAALNNGDGSAGNAFYGSGAVSASYVSTVGGAEFRPVKIQLGYVIRVD